MTVARPARLLAISFASVILFSGFGSCSGDLRALCSNELPGFEKEFGDAMASLDSSITGAPERRIASESKGAANLAGPARETWQRWAESRLKATQDFIDRTYGDPEFAIIRKELGEVANGLVSFHGYAELGKADRMSRSLATVREHAWRARELACNVK